MRLSAAVLAAAALLGATATGAAPSAWEARAPMPLPRTEVSAAVFGSEIVVLGGFTIDGGASRRADAYSPARDVWRRLPDLPIGVHHAMAVGVGGEPYVLGGYSGAGATLRTAFVLERAGGGRCRACRSRARLRVPRRGRRIVVAGGIGEGRRLARNALAFDLRTRRWSVVPGPTPREHLGVTSLGGVVYAVGGRTAGLDTNLLNFESYRPGDRAWQRLQPVPDPRGGTGAAALAGGWSRSAARSRRDDRGGARVPDRRAALGTARRPTDAAARRRRRRFRRSGLRHRRRTRAGAHRQLGERGARRRS